MSYCTYPDSPTYAAFRANATYRPAPYPADPDRLPGHKIVNGVAIQDSRPQPTVAMQSACRGPVPYANRDYSQWYWAGMEQTVSPIRSLRNPVCVGTRSNPVTKGNGKRHHVSTEDYPLHKEWEKLREKERNGETVIVKTPPVPRSDILIITSLAPLTPHQQMRQELRDAIKTAPAASEWIDDKVTYPLPFGMKLGRHGGTEIAVWGNYKPKGSKYNVSTKSVVVGYLKGDRFVAIEDCLMFEKALGKIMELVKEHKLDKPTPEPTEPASQKAAA